MHYFSYRPPAPLNELVEFFWMLAGGAADRRERVFPSGTSELVINLREDEIRIFDSVSTERFQRLSGAVVSGTYSHPFICDAKQHGSIIGVHFRPGGAFPVLPVPATELTDSHVSLEDLWGRGARELREKLCEARTLHKRFEIVQQCLLGRLRRAPGRHPAVQAALRYFGVAGTGRSIREVAAELCMSQRRFIELFSTQVGLTPKLLCRTLRFQHARAFAAGDVRRLAGTDQKSVRRGIDWADMAIACGYYDQAHFINDFHDLSGLSPMEYIRQVVSARGLKDNHLPLATQVNFFQYAQDVEFENGSRREVKQ